MVPAGPVIPWEWPGGFVARTIGLALAVGFLWLIGRMRAVPRGSRTALNVSCACWVVLSVIIAALGKDIDSIGPALACSAIASIPFVVVAARFWSGRNVSR